MLEPLRKKVGLWFAKFRFRNQGDAVQYFTRAFSRAGSALVLLPEDPSRVKAASELLSILSRRFRGSRLTVLVGEHIQTIPSGLRTPNFIRLYRDAINKFFLPSTHVIAEIKRSDYDVAIDLNLDLVLPYAYICRASNARIRVGFVKESSDIFYNFQIKSRGDHPSPYSYLTECLEMF